MSSPRDMCRLIVIVAAISIISCEAAESACGNFEFPTLTDQQIFNQFEGAVLKIEAHEVGTGFLIDSKVMY